MVMMTMVVTMAKIMAMAMMTNMAMLACGHMGKATMFLFKATAPEASACHRSSPFVDPYRQGSLRGRFRLASEREA